jgi:BASS family bile acid:Na+ symporter
MPLYGLFASLQRHATTLMALCLLVGLAVPPLAHALRYTVVPFAVLTIMLSLVRLDAERLAMHLRRPLVASAFGLAAMVVPALLALGVIRLTGPAGGDLLTGIGIISATPPLLSAPAYALVLGLDGAFALLGTVPASLLAPLLMPFLVGWLLGIDLEFGASTLMARLAVMVFAAFVGAALLRRTIGGERIEARAAYVDGAMVLVLCTFGIGVMDGIGETLVASPAKVARYVASAFALCIALQGLALISSWWLGKHRAFTVCLLCPLYIMPALMRPLLRRVV